jgi:hypothetical protein
VNGYEIRLNLCILNSNYIVPDSSLAGITNKLLRSVFKENPYLFYVGSTTIKTELYTTAFIVFMNFRRCYMKAKRSRGDFVSYN